MSDPTKDTLHQQDEARDNAQAEVEQIEQESTQTAEKSETSSENQEAGVEGLDSSSPGVGDISPAPDEELGTAQEPRVAQDMHVEDELGADQDSDADKHVVDESGVDEQETEKRSSDIDLVEEKSDEPTDTSSSIKDETKATQDVEADLEKKPASEAAATEAAADGVGHEMTFTAHLQELRTRLTRSLVGIFVGFLACYGFSEHLFRKLMEPLISLLQPKDGTLIYTGLPEAFFTHLKVAAVAGLFLASPYVFYQIWMFIAPGLYENERKWMIPIALSSAILFVTGALFGYYIVFPFGFQFFLGYATDFVTPMPSVREYFSFSMTMLFAFGLVFELPLFIFFLARLGMVTHKSLRKFQKYSILGSFIVAAILTPPDVVSQVFMALPLCILYEVGIWIAYVFGRKPKEEAQSKGDEEGAQA